MIIVANVMAEPIEDVEAIRTALVGQWTGAVRWTDSWRGGGAICSTRSALAVGCRGCSGEFGAEFDRSSVDKVDIES